MPGTPKNVRVGPGWLYIGAVGATEPTDLDTDWDYADWTPIGYTDEGSEFQFDRTVENVEVAEELDPVLTFETSRSTKISFASAEITARNLQVALNGGDINVSGATTTFEPPEAGDITYVAIGWQATDGLERWVFRKALSAEPVSIGRRKSPDKAVIQMGFQVVKPDSGAPWKAIFDTDYVAAAS